MLQHVLVWFRVRGGVMAAMAMHFALGGAYGLGFAPVSWWPLALIALTCHLAALERLQSWRVSGLCGWMFGFGFFAVSLHWVAESFAFGPAGLRELGWIAVLGLSLGLGLFNALFSALTHCRWCKGVSRSVEQAILWTVVEWLRTSLFTGFPWNLTAYVWSDTLPMLQSTAFTGVYGLGFLTVLTSASLSGLLVEKKTWSRAAICASMVVVLLGTYIGGTFRLQPRVPDASQFRVRIVQANIRQDRKWNITERERILAEYLEETVNAGDVPSVVVWPETAVPFLLDEDAARRVLIARALPPQGVLITGAHRREVAGPDQRFFNSVLTVASNGTVIGRYDKVHLVPFGEFVPLAALNPFPRLTASLADFTPGMTHNVADLGNGIVVAPLICYEAIFPGDLRAHGAKATVLVNVTNDAWFGTSWGPYQHLAIARVRAIELGVPLIRAANTGISGVFDSFGRPVATIPLGVRSSVDVDVPSPLPARTVYARIGDLPLFSLIAIIMAFSAVKRARRHSLAPPRTAQTSNG
ncbi:apolipoprotein N-acyltransferase [Microvirga splendida]|uniref:Apolipoprotein N-acyltransferase n=1 Tax=Microvirga splendida TaxID=2795727 RepID=A0ABS0Y3T6_9HYPH|nr:apolipoprotein N-acyltransferase [Microvirga splendida]MBJ6126971.1 apolipoprotein N-acyltransferase [Microvirga splendida]